uniref:Uncharacterized protein n=1 Tax=Caenorhabditis japonica TaxID=281687 RepID=A0A8R1IC12_CAEJA
MPTDLWPISIVPLSTVQPTRFHFKQFNPSSTHRHNAVTTSAKMASPKLPSLHIAHHRRCESHRSQNLTPADLQPGRDEAHRAALARKQAAKAQKALERAAEERQPEAPMPESLLPRLTKPEPVEQTSSGSDIEISVEEDDYEDAAQQIETTKHSHEKVQGSAAASHAKEHTDNNDPAEEDPSEEFNPLLVEDNEGRLSEQVDGLVIPRNRTFT